MKTFELICSKDGVNIDYAETITAPKEPDYWKCADIAEAHSCDYFCINELEFEEIMPCF